MSRCIAYEEKTTISPDVLIGGIAANCANCEVWTGEHCRDEPYIITIHEPASIYHYGWQLLEGTDR